jgi:fatty acid amide hydrolase 2
MTARSAVELARAIRDREITAAEVVEAHIERHEQFGPRINAIVASRFDEAREEAAAADALIASCSSPADLPPLLGVPFTVKESIAVRGMPSSAGLAARRDFRSPESAPAVRRLCAAGAIPLGVTNTSELTLWIESENRLYGRTNNPYDPRRAAGGSSGGEGAAVGYGGSPFGLASDIAGSIRIPACFCGVFGHKPSSGLVPNSGLYPPTVGTAGRLLGTGPLARRAEDLMPLLRTIAGPDGIDPLVREVTLGDPSLVSLDGISVVTVEASARRPISREVRDARERAVGALAAAGARVRSIPMRSWRTAVAPFLATLQAESGSDATTLQLLEAAGEARPTWRSLLRRGGPHTLPTRAALAAELLPRGAGSETRPQRRLLQAGRALVDELLDAIGDGVLLHPVHPTVAPPHGRTLGRLWLLAPAAVFNLAGVPVTEVPLGLSERGLPLGVQVAAGLDRDHVAIAVARELERVFGGWRPPPVPPASPTSNLNTARTRFQGPRR